MEGFHVGLSYAPFCLEEITPRDPWLLLPRERLFSLSDAQAHHPQVPHTTPCTFLIPQKPFFDVASGVSMTLSASHHLAIL